MHKLKKSDITLSSFDIDIGTGIALESIFIPTSDRYDTSRDIPELIHINQYTKHYFNIYTIARNIVSAISDKAIREKVYMDEHLMAEVIDEVNIIASLYETTKCKPILFIPDYTKLYKSMNIDKEVTLSGKEYMLEQYILSFAKKKIYGVNMDIVYNTHSLPATSDKVLITTHITIDLLNIKKAPHLELLESHTGKLKSKYAWYSKYHKIGKLDMSIFPFQEVLLYILGDNTVTKPARLGARKELYRLAKDSKWTPYTNSIKVTQDLRSSEILKDLIKNFKPSY